MPSTVSAATNTLGDNVGLVAAVIAVIVAQVLKPFSEWTVTRRFKASLMVGSGGFPSSHSSLVTALATGAAYQAGLGDPAFATALVLALVVMYDAMGVRRQAGYHATAINNLVTAFPSDANLGGSRGNAASRSDGGGYQSAEGGPGGGEDDEALLGGGGNGGGVEDIGEQFNRGFQEFLQAIQERPLREHIGHTPVQVMAGGVLGVVVGTAYALALRATEGEKA